VEIDFVSGVPVAINGTPYSPATLLETLNHLAGENGVGRVDMVENRFVGMKSRGVYETPGGTVLHVAHRALESITLDREVMHIRDTLVPKYAQLVYNGFWFSPERTMLQAAIDEAQREVTGTVRVKLYKGNCLVVGRKSPCSLYRNDFVTSRPIRSTISTMPKDSFV
jgi:argininosuccinate synthase